MPNKTVKRRAPQKTRKGAVAGKKGEGKGRQGCNGGSTDYPKVIANSVFALTLPVRKAYQVKDSISMFEKPIEEITVDLLNCVNRSLTLLKKPKLSIIKGTHHHQIMEQVIAKLKSDILPSGYSFEINKDHHGTYFFTLYKLVSFGSFWHTFPVKPALDQLKKYPHLKECFLDIMYLFIQQLDMNCWWGNWYPYDFVLHDQEGFADWFDNGFDSDDDEEKEKKWKDWQDLKKNYDEGEAYQCMKALQRRKVNLKKMQALLSRTRSKNPVVTWMKEAIKLLESGRSINHYNNEFWEEYIHDDGGIRLTDQAIIIWNEDELYDIGCEQVDAEWNNMGCQEPCNYYHLWSGRKSLNFSNLKEEEEWLLKVSILNQNYNTYVLNDK